jgi:hypothetical protein
VNTVLNITITFEDIIHCFVFYLKHNVSETGLCLHLQMKATQFGPIDRAVTTQFWKRRTIRKNISLPFSL